MFAVVVLGIGFIMIAAIFPVAIQQTKATRDEAAAASMARGAVNEISELATDAELPALTTPPPTPPPAGTVVPGCVFSIRDPQPGATGSNAAFVTLQSNLRPKFGSDDYLWDKFKGNLIQSTDPRYGYVVLYRRDLISKGPAAPPPQFTPSPYAQIYVIATQVRNRPVYSTDQGPAAQQLGDIAYPYSNADSRVLTYNLQARPVKVIVSNDTNDAGPAGQKAAVDVCWLCTNFTTPADSYAGQNAQAAAEGSYIIIARDNIKSPANDKGRMNGRVYRLGNRRTDLDQANQIAYELQPGGDFSPDPGANGVLGDAGTRNGDDICALGIDNAETKSSVTFEGPADAFVVGRNPIAGSKPPQFDGASQDITLYTTFVQLK